MSVIVLPPQSYSLAALSPPTTALTDQCPASLLWPLNFLLFVGLETYFFSDKQLLI
jgi:hypothetical protein